MYYASIASATVFNIFLNSPFIWPTQACNMIKCPQDEREMGLKKMNNSFPTKIKEKYPKHSSNKDIQKSMKIGIAK